MQLGLWNRRRLNNALSFRFRCIFPHSGVHLHSLEGGLKCPLPSSSQSPRPEAVGRNSIALASGKYERPSRVHSL